MLLGIEIRLFLVIDAFSRFSGMLFARSAGRSLQLAKQLLESTVTSSGRRRRPTGGGITVGSWQRFRNPRLTPRIRRFLTPANISRCGLRKIRSALVRLREQRQSGETLGRNVAAGALFTGAPCFQGYFLALLATILGRLDLPQTLK